MTGSLAGVDLEERDVTRPAPPLTAICLTENGADELGGRGVETTMLQWGVIEHQANQVMSRPAVTVCGPRESPSFRRATDRVVAAEGYGDREIVLA